MVLQSFPPFSYAWVCKEPQILPVPGAWAPFGLPFPHPCSSSCPCARDGNGSKYPQFAFYTWLPITQEGKRKHKPNKQNVIGVIRFQQKEEPPPLFFQGSAPARGRGSGICAGGTGKVPLDGNGARCHGQHLCAGDSGFLELCGKDRNQIRALDSSFATAEPRIRFMRYE